MTDELRARQHLVLVLDSIAERWGREALLEYPRFRQAVAFIEGREPPPPRAALLGLLDSVYMLIGRDEAFGARQGDDTIREAINAAHAVLRTGGHNG